MSRKLLIGPPKPRDDAAFWRTATWMGALFSLVVGITLGFSIGHTFTRDGQQAELDAETYRQHAIERDEAADICGQAFNDVAFRATLALNYARYWSEWAKAAGAYADSLRAEPIVEWTAGR